MTDDLTQHAVQDLTGTLVLVATPIGNLGDITLRAVDVLRACNHIVAEDTRRTRKLLSHLGLDGTRLSRLDAYAQEADLARVLQWLENDESVALVTDAGCPGVSDPGASLVRAAVQAGVKVTALPGASAVTMAVGLSGLVDGPFYFGGFATRGEGNQAEQIRELAERPEPCVLFESPHRIGETLKALADAMPSRQVMVARELTKLHEETVRGPLAEVASTSREWLGEITIVLGPWTPEQKGAPDDDEVDRRIDEQLAGGTHTRTIAERIAAWSGRGRREVYARVLERKTMMRR